MKLAFFQNIMYIVTCEWVCLYEIFGYHNTGVDPMHMGHVP